jgi:hypothetical protein
MLIRIGYDIRFELTQDVPFLALVRVHPSRQADLRSSDLIRTDAYTGVEEYLDTFGNACSRFLARSGPLCLSARAIIEDAASQIRPVLMLAKFHCQTYWLYRGEQ